MTVSRAVLPENATADEHKKLKISWKSLMYYRAKRSGARYCRDKLPACLSVCLSVTLVDCDHMRWNSVAYYAPAFRRPSLKFE